MPESWLVTDTTTMWIVVQTLLVCGIVAFLSLPPELAPNARFAMVMHYGWVFFMGSIIFQAIVAAIAAGVTSIWISITWWKIVVFPLFGTMVMWVTGSICYCGLFTEVNFGSRSGAIQYRRIVGKPLTRLIPILLGATSAYVLAIVSGWVLWVSLALILLISFGSRAILSQELPHDLYN